MKVPVIRLTIIGVDEIGDVLVAAVDEEDKVITSHISSSYSWAKEDIMRDSHQNDMKSRYPKGFTLKWCFDHNGPYPNQE